MKNIPKNVKAYKQTPEFTEKTVPKGLLNSHQTKESSWAKIVILEGELLYRILDPMIEEVRLTTEIFGVVEPTILHEVELVGEVRFYVEFYR